MGKCAEAILQCKVLGYSLPQTNENVIEASAGFNSVSSHGILDKCVGVMDG